MGLPIETELDGPRIYLDGSEYRALFTLQVREMLHPGETARVFVTLVFPHNLMGKLHPDKPLLLRERYHSMVRATSSRPSTLKDM